MAHHLDFIQRNDILKGLSFIDGHPVPSNHEWNEYHIHHNGNIYPFKYAVFCASQYTITPFKTTEDFKSDPGTRKKIASLGFNIQYQAQVKNGDEPNFWVGGSHQGKDNSIDMYSNFVKNKYWSTDHTLDTGTGLRIKQILKTIKVNDRFAIRRFDRRKGKIEIQIAGTVKGINNIDAGRVEIMWDEQSYIYDGPKPSGPGAGNLWDTLTPVSRPEDILLLFNYKKIVRRIARLAWNDQGWVLPSGPVGKSKNNESHEGRHGYGHEEWLFDLSKITDGYHYSFLEPVRKQQDAFANKLFSVWLYTYNSITKKRYWVGEITQVEVLDHSHALIIDQKYQEKGWRNEMAAQIKTSGANEKGFSKWQGVDLFNIRFKPEHLIVNDPYIELKPDHPVYNISRYAFGHYTPTFAVPLPEPESEDFKFKPRAVPRKLKGKGGPKTKLTYRAPRFVENLLLHDEIMEKLLDRLEIIYGAANVRDEHPAGYGYNSIDVVANSGKGLIFYEVKSYNSLIISIREALGQIMEYALWHNKQKAKKMIIVTVVPATEESVQYFQHLRKTFNLNIYYQSIDMVTGQLSTEV